MRNDDRIAFEDFLERLDGQVGKMLVGSASPTVIKSLRESLRHAFCAGLVHGRAKRDKRMFVVGLIKGSEQARGRRK